MITQFLKAVTTLAEFVDDFTEAHVRADNPRAPDNYSMSIVHATGGASSVPDLLLRGRTRLVYSAIRAPRPHRAVSYLSGEFTTSE
jgi:hypothetical protein